MLLIMQQTKFSETLLSLDSRQNRARWRSQLGQRFFQLAMAVDLAEPTMTAAYSVMPLGNTTAITSSGTIMAGMTAVAQLQGMAKSVILPTHK